MNDQQQSRADALTDEHIATLKLAARAVTPQDIDGAERIESRPDGSYITCPACEGEGCIPFESDYCNYDHVAIGVQFYGVGTEPGAAEAYFRAAKPATILALLDRLERAESALAAPPVEQPAAAPADEPAVSFEAWCDRFPEISAVERLRDAWQEARAAASPAAEAVAYLSTDPKHWDKCRIKPQGTFTVPVFRTPQPAQADAPAEVFPYQKTFNAIAAATSVEGGHVSISVKAFRDAFGGAVAEAREPIAWVTDDDRAITAAQKQRALADGGATASSVRPYSIPCYAVSAPADAEEAVPIAIYQVECGIQQGQVTYRDADKAEYDERQPSSRRIVYTAPTASRMARLTDEQRESIEHAATWLGRSEDLQNKAHAKRLCDLLNGGDNDR